MGNETPEMPDIHALIADHHGALYAYAYRLAGQAAEAEDLTQQTFLVAHQKLDQLRDAEKARGWLFRVLRNLFLKSRRKPEPSSPGPVETDWEALADADSLPDASPDIDQQRLQMALDALPEPYRVVVVMFYFEQSSYKEIAEQLEVKIGTVMSRLARGKAKLREYLFAAAREGSLGGGVLPSSSLEQTPE